MKDICSAALPNGWTFVIVGDGFRALIAAIKLNARYPERVYLAGQLPKYSKYFFNSHNRWNLPKSCQKEFALNWALKEIASRNRDEIPVVVPLSDEYDQILKHRQNSLERSFLTGCEPNLFGEGVFQ